MKTPRQARQATINSMPGHAVRGLPASINAVATTAFEKQFVTEMTKSHATRVLIPELRRGHVLKQVDRLVEGNRAAAVRAEAALIRTETVLNGLNKTPRSF